MKHFGALFPLSLPINQRFGTAGDVGRKILGFEPFS